MIPSPVSRRFLIVAEANDSSLVVLRQTEAKEINHKADWQVKPRYTRIPSLAGIRLGEMSRNIGAYRVLYSARARWTFATAMPPSPTAAAQRLTEPERTSPAANTPGWLVSSGPGARFIFCQAEDCAHFCAGEDEAFVVALDLGGEPAGAR